MKGVKVSCEYRFAYLICNSWLCCRASSTSLGRSSRGNVTLSSLHAWIGGVDSDSLPTSSSFGSIA
jgi:hypothetical protein